MDLPAPGESTTSRSESHQSAGSTSALSAWKGRVSQLGWKSYLTAVVAFVATLGAFTEALDGTFDRGIEACRTVRVCDPMPPPVLVGTLSEVRVGAAHLTQREAYAERNLPVPANLSEQDGNWPGQLITYRVEFQGLEQAVSRVRWTLYDATTGRRIPNGTSGWQTVHAPAFPDGRWTVEARETDVNVGLAWVPYVAPGSFVVEIELLNADGIHLDLERTGPFDVEPGAVPNLEG